MKWLVALIVVFAGCTSQPSAPTDAVDDAAPEPDLNVWQKCEQVLVTVPVDDDAVEVPSNLQPITGSLPGTVAYTVWSIACEPGTATIGFVQVVGDAMWNGYATLLHVQDERLPANLTATEGPTVVVILDGVESDVNLKTFLAMARVPGQLGVLGDPTHRMEMTAHPDSPMHMDALTIAFYDERGQIASAEQDLSRLHAGIGQIRSDGEFLPWDGVLPGTSQMTAGSAASGHRFDLQWT